MAAVSCNKEQRPDDATLSPITLTATEAGATKALLDNGTFAANGNQVQVYEMPSPPPDRICYKVTNRIPRANRADSIRLFEENLRKFLKEQDLHM